MATRFNTSWPRFNGLFYYFNITKDIFIDLLGSFSLFGLSYWYLIVTLMYFIYINIYLYHRMSLLCTTRLLENFKSLSSSSDYFFHLSTFIFYIIITLLSEKKRGGNKKKERKAWSLHESLTPKRQALHWLYFSKTDSPLNCLENTTAEDGTPIQTQICSIPFSFFSEG